MSNEIERGLELRPWRLLELLVVASLGALGPLIAFVWWTNDREAEIAQFKAQLAKPKVYNPPDRTLGTAYQNTSGGVKIVITSATSNTDGPP